MAKGGIKARISSLFLVEIYQSKPTTVFYYRLTSFFFFVLVLRFFFSPAAVMSDERHKKKGKYHDFVKFISRFTNILYRLKNFMGLMMGFVISIFIFYEFSCCSCRILECDKIFRKLNDCNLESVPLEFFTKIKHLCGRVTGYTQRYFCSSQSASRCIKFVYFSISYAQFRIQILNFCANLTVATCEDDAE